MAESIQERVERFFEAFLAPLLNGGVAVVGRPHGVASLDHASLARTAKSETDAAIYAALHHGAAAIAPVARLPYPDRGSMALALAGHDLIAVTDPLLDRWGSRRALPRMLELVERLVEAAGAPRTRGQALSRHVVVSRLLRLERRDVVVKNWAYTYRFFGRRVPANVVAFPKLRRVRSEVTLRPVHELLEAAETKWGLPITQVARTLVAASPLTPLLEPGTGTTLGRLGGAELEWLADPVIRRAVARFLRGASEEDLLNYAGALLAPELAGLPDETRTSLALLFAELGAEDALDREPGHTLEALAGGHPGAQALAALFVVGLGATGLLNGLAPRDALIVRSRAAALRSALPPQALVRARRVLGVVDENLLIPLEDAS